MNSTLLSRNYKQKWTKLCRISTVAWESIEIDSVNAKSPFSPFKTSYIARTGNLNTTYLLFLLEFSIDDVHITRYASIQNVVSFLENIQGGNNPWVPRGLNLKSFIFAPYRAMYIHFEGPKYLRSVPASVLQWKHCLSKLTDSLSKKFKVLDNSMSSNYLLC